MVVMLLQQHIPSLAAHPHSPGTSLGHSPLGSSSYEKVVQLDAVTPLGDTGLYPTGLAATSPPPQPPPPQPPPPQPQQQPQQHQQQQQPQAAAGPPQPPPPPARPAPHAPHAHYDNRAMQYYRLWIYTCNGLLLVCVLGFAVVACHTVVFDSRRSLVPGLSLLQPTFLYGYLAVLSQSGLIQMIGCLGARRLNQKLLNVYWLLLFLLLFGDAMVGVVWLFRFESICEELRPWLRQRLLQEYGADNYFTSTWDAYQRDNRCCGVQGPADYTALNRSLGWLPDSCCRVPPYLYQQPPRSAALRNFHHYGTTTSTPSTTTVGLEDEYHIMSNLPDGDGRPGVVQDAADLYCGGEAPPPPPAPNPGAGAGASSTVSSSSVGSGGASTAGGGGGGGVGGGAAVVPTGGGRIITLLRPTPPPPPRYYRTGCEERLLAWLKSAADMLFIVGYCILGFVKVCFLGILRYEIKEMIQKIRMLQGELSAPQLTSPDQDPQGGKSPPPGAQAQQAARFSNNNGSLVTGRGPQDDSPVIGSSRTPQERRGRADSGTTPLLLQQADSLHTTPLHQNPGGPLLAHGGGGGGGGGGGAPTTSMTASSVEAPVQLQHTPMLHHRHHHHHLSLQDGNDSDTNSHCALLMSDETAGPGGGPGGGGPGDGKVTRQGSNGNNNYELHELHDINRVLLARSRPPHRTDI